MNRHPATTTAAGVPTSGTATLVNGLVNADTGTLEAAYEYDPFGQLLRAEGAYAKENPFRFSTQFVDDETGLVYHNARYYQPSLGRFINRDPIEESGGLNLYAYVSNDAANKWDVLGRMGYQFVPPPDANGGAWIDIGPGLRLYTGGGASSSGRIGVVVDGRDVNNPAPPSSGFIEGTAVFSPQDSLDLGKRFGSWGSPNAPTLSEIFGNVPQGTVIIGPVNVVDNDVQPGPATSAGATEPTGTTSQSPAATEITAPKSPSGTAAATADSGSTQAAPSTTTVPRTAAPDTALDSAQNTNAVGAGTTVVPNANDTLLGKLNLLVATVGGQTADSALDIATVAALGAQEGLRDHVGISGDIALNILPVPRAGQFGPFPAGIGWGAAVDANFKDGITGNQYVTVGKFGAAGSLGITFDIPFFGPGAGGQTAGEFTLSGGIGPGGALKFGVDSNGNLTDIKITIGVGFGFELGGAAPFPKG